MNRPPKARKISVFLAFPRFSAAVCFGKKLLTTDLTTYGFDRKNRISGCRVTVTHQFWELAQAGSTPVIPTKNQPKMRFFAPLSADFLLIIGFYPPLWENSLTAEQHKPLFFRRLFLCLLRSKIYSAFCSSITISFLNASSSLTKSNCLFSNAFNLRLQAFPL